MGKTEKKATGPTPGAATILNAKLIKQFCDYIREGLTAEVACNLLGIAPSTYYSWLRKGSKFYDVSQIPKGPFKIYYDFVAEYRKATGLYIRTLTVEFHDEDNKEHGNYRRAAFALSRRDRRTWGKDEPIGGTEQQFDPDDRFD